MRRTFEQFQTIGRSTFPRHKRGVDILGIVSVFMLVGISVSGIWQFFAHEPDPAFFAYRPGFESGFSSQQSVGAQVHDLFATGTGAVALFGSAWFAYRISHAVPVVGVLTMIVAFLASATAALVRFNAIKLEGRAFDEADTGYLQVFTESVQFVVTDRGQSGPTAFRIAVLAHILTVPTLVGFSWWWIRRAIEARTVELENQPERTWLRYREGQTPGAR